MRFRGKGSTNHVTRSGRSARLYTILGKSFDPKPVPYPAIFLFPETLPHFECHISLVKYHSFLWDNIYNSIPLCLLVRAI